MSTGTRSRLSNLELVRYLAILTAVMVAFHLYLALVSRGVVDLIAAALLVLAALVALGGYLLWRRRLELQPFGLLVFHVMTFVVVVGSVSVHAFATSPAGTNYRVSGGLVWLVGLWAIGLLVHVLAANSSRGFDGVEP